MSIELENAHVIYNYQGLREISNDTDGHYELGCDIDCTESAKDNNGLGWKPFDFSGKLSGNGYCLSNMYSKQGGLFNKFTGEISGVGFRNWKIEDVNDTGVFASWVETSGVVERCYVENCLILPKVFEGQASSWVASNKNAAAFIGVLRQGTIKECYASNCIIGQEKANYNQFTEWVTGFIAKIDRFGMVCDCYSRNCKIYALSNGAGFIGQEDYFTYIDPDTTGTRRCYSANRIIIRNKSTSSSYIKGAFCGNASSRAIDLQEGNVYDSSIAGYGLSNNGYGYGKITEQMKDKNTFEALKWEFSIVNDDGTVIKKTWRIEDGLTYPYLQFNKQYKELVPTAFLKIKSEKHGDLYAPLVSPFDVNLDVTPHLYIRIENSDVGGK